MKNAGNAGCLCGDIRLKIEGAPVAVTQCHCGDCQKSTGGGVVLVIMVQKQNLEVVQGRPMHFDKASDNGTQVDRCFCGICGTPLFSELEAYPDLLAVKAGVWDEDQEFAPTSAVWTASAPKWHHVPDQLPQFPKARF